MKEIVEGIFEEEKKSTVQVAKEMGIPLSTVRVNTLGTTMKWLEKVAKFFGWKVSVVVEKGEVKKEYEIK